jgi:uncharacterized phage-associated protein
MLTAKLIYSYFASAKFFSITEDSSAEIQQNLSQAEIELHVHTHMREVTSIMTIVL